MDRFCGSFLAALAIVLGSLVLGPAASADTTLTVGKAAPNADAIIPINIGDKLGIFKRRGLTLSILDFNSGSRMVQAMTAGSIDIGAGSGTEMAFVGRGTPMLAVCETAGPAPFLSIGVPWDSSVQSIDGLKGEKFGISSVGSLTDWLSRELARKQGWGPNDLRQVAVGNGPNSIIAAFRDHLVGADIAATSFLLDIQERKMGRLLAPVSSYEGNLASGALYASRQVIARNPDAIRAFLGGWIETIGFMRTHKDETVKIESALTGFAPSVMSRNYDLTIGMFRPDCRFDDDSLATLAQSFVDQKITTALPDMSPLYTEDFLQ